MKSRIAVGMIEQKLVTMKRSILHSLCLIFVLAPFWYPLKQEASSNSIALLLSPQSISAGMSFRVLIAARTPLNDVGLEVSQQQLGIIKPKSILAAGGGPPFWQAYEFPAKKEGFYRISVSRNAVSIASQTLKAGKQKSWQGTSEFIWKSEKSWDRGWENLYSAWLERLFYVKTEGITWIIPGPKLW